MLSYRPGETDPSGINWRPFLHPDDQARLEREFEAHFGDDTLHTTSELFHRRT